MSHIGDPNLPFDTRYTKFSHTFLLTLLFFVVVCLKTVKTRGKNSYFAVSIERNVVYYVVSHCCKGKHTRCWANVRALIGVSCFSCVYVLCKSHFIDKSAQNTTRAHTTKYWEENFILCVYSVLACCILFCSLGPFPFIIKLKWWKKNINKNLRRIFLAPIFY